MTLKEKIKSKEVIENVRAIVTAGFFALVIRTLLFEPFHIPSESMVPSLLIGDYLFVSKYSYGYSRYALPFGLPLFSGRVLAKTPDRGDVVVFHGTHDDRNYIKRLIGLPGDRIRLAEGVVYINDKPLPLTPNGTYWATKHPGHSEDGEKIQVPHFIETLPNGVTHPVIKYYEFGASRLDNMPAGVEEYIVPMGHYFVMGDNRDNSGDSRVLGQMSYIPDDHLIGKAQFIFFSTDGTAQVWEFWKWFSAMRYPRFFSLIR